MRSEADLVRQTLRDALLPEKGAEYEIRYFAGEVPVKYGEEEHTWVTAVSQGLRVVCDGPEFRVSMARQKKPLVPGLFNGQDGCYRRALRIAINGDAVGNNADYYIHIMGDLVMVTKQKINIAQMVGDQSMTTQDQVVMDRIREQKREEKKNGGAG